MCPPSSLSPVSELLFSSLSPSPSASVSLSGVPVPTPVSTSPPLWALFPDKLINRSSRLTEVLGQVWHLNQRLGFPRPIDYLPRSLSTTNEPMDRASAHLPAGLLTPSGGRGEDLEGAQ